ncbi:MAG: transposase [Clostridia bacterium]|nr:transposase [Clostridia bacterium]
MPRHARKDLVSNYVHIMAQGINKEYIFQDDSCKKKYWDLLQKKKSDFNINLISYCIMDNHVHLVIYYKEVDELSMFMKKINTAYAKWYNNKKERVGYVFRDRYKSEQIFDFHYLYSCIIYVHNNPVKAKIVDKPEQYKYSSYNAFLSDSYILKSKVLELLNLDLEQFKNIFIKSKNLDFYSFRGISPQKVIKSYLKVNNIENIKEIISKKHVKELAILLKEKSKLSYNEIADLLGISRKTLYRIMNNLD